MLFLAAFLGSLTGVIFSEVVKLTVRAWKKHRIHTKALNDWGKSYSFPREHWESNKSYKKRLVSYIIGQENPDRPKGATPYFHNHHNF